MNSMMQAFTYNDHEVRTVERDGEPWWVLADVCNALGLSQPSRVASRLDEDEKGVTKTHTPGGEQELTIINEPGLYTVILRSNKPEAKPFKRWITHDVLPAIRKTGQYATDGQASTVEQLAQEVRKLGEKIDAMAAQRAALPKTTSADDQKKRRWMRVFNAKLDLMVESTGESRNQLLHDLYKNLERATGLIIDNERYRAMEVYGLEDCSGVEAIYYNNRLRQATMWMMD